MEEYGESKALPTPVAAGHFLNGLNTGFNSFCFGISDVENDAVNYPVDVLPNHPRSET